LVNFITSSPPNKRKASPQNCKVPVENFLATVLDFIFILQELRRDDDPVVNKSVLLLTVFLLLHPHVEEAETYDRIVQFLKAFHVKKRTMSMLGIC